MEKENKIHWKEYEPNNIYNVDSYEAIKKIPDNSIDLIITDPPYEIIGGGGGGCFGTGQRNYHAEYTALDRKDTKREGLRISSNFNNLKSNLQAICGGFDYSLLEELDRVMKKINIYIWCNKNQVRPLMQHYEEKGCNVDLLVWCKTNPLPTCNNKYLSDLEYCVFARANNTALHGTYETKSKFLVSPANVEDKKKYKHPTIKPLNRIKDYIINSSNEGDIVLDVFLGSGTTAVASKELGRQYIGFELNKEYFDIAQDRLKGITQIERKQKDAGILDIFDFLGEEE